MQQVTVRVPASTSNLGPGFDCLGVALRIYNDVAVTDDASGREIHPRIVSQAANLFFKRSRCRPFSFSCSIAEKIPRSRGLGSSATIRLGILHALNWLSGNPLERLMIFQLCAELEGHPDNAAPTTFGGFTVVQSRRSAWAPCSKWGAGPTVQRFEVSANLFFVLLVPDWEIKTSTARRILPSRIRWTAAVDNCASACAITAAFASGNYRNLRGAFCDHLHQPYRKKLISFLPSVIAAAERAGALGAFLSGSGSTIAAVTLQSPKKVASAMVHAAGSASAHTLITRADNRGARVLPFRTSDMRPRAGDQLRCPQSAICN
jgi:homoserine kinase